MVCLFFFAKKWQKITKNHLSTANLPPKILAGSQLSSSICSPKSQTGPSRLHTKCRALPHPHKCGMFPQLNLYTPIFVSSQILHSTLHRVPSVSFTHTVICLKGRKFGSSIPKLQINLKALLILTPPNPRFFRSRHYSFI